MGKKRHKSLPFNTGITWEHLLLAASLKKNSKTIQEFKSENTIMSIQLSKKCLKGMI